MLMRAIHPGEVLKEELEAMGVSLTALARQNRRASQSRVPDHCRQARRNGRHRVVARSAFTLGAGLTP